MTEPATTHPTAVDTVNAVDTAAPPTDPLRIGILVFDGVEPLDAIGPAQVFWSIENVRVLMPDVRPVEVLLVAETSVPVRCGHGLVIHPTTTYDGCPALDVLVVPGGTGSEDDDATAVLGRRFQCRHETTLRFVRAQAAQADIVASVCTGTFILVGAGLLAGRRANTHWYSRDELVRAMAERGEPFELVEARVVDDGNVVTSGGVSSGIDLALHLVDRLLGPDCRQMVELAIERETPVSADRSSSVAPAGDTDDRLAVTAGQ